MDAHHLDQTGLKTFILATDGEFAPFQPENDQVWEMSLSGPDSHPIYLHTTYSLRTRSMRLFPSFIIGNQRFAEAGIFFNRPAVTQYSPDAIQVTCAPVKGTQIVFDCFVPESDVLVGGIEILNTGEDPFKLTIELAAVLAPMGKGIPTRPDKDGITQIITGQSDNLFPALFMTGGPTAVVSPYPALKVPVHLKPQQSRQLTWALASKDSRAASLDAARTVTASPWRQTVQAHVMKHASQTLLIQTGNPDWNSAFYLSQTQAMTHWVPVRKHNARPCFIRSRLPDQALPDQREVENLDDLTLLEANHLAQVLLPAQSEKMVSVVTQFLARIDENGRVPSRLVPSPFVNKPFRECPLLAHLSFELYKITGDKDFLHTVFPQLCLSLDSWFADQREPDSAKPPSWKDPQQLQLDTGLFTFDIWEETGRGLDICKVESPALMAMFHREASALSQIAKVLGEKSAHKKYNNLTKSLREKIDKSWSDHQNCFEYLDIQSQLSPSQELNYLGKVQKHHQIDKTFLQPQRLHIHLHAADERTRVCIIRINGEDPKGKPIQEVFKTPDIRWVIGRANLTTQLPYKSIQSLSIEGLQPEDQFLLETAEFSQSDITCLLPLWSRAITKDQCEALLKSHLSVDQAALRFGIPETWKSIRDLPDKLPIRTNILWNTLIIQGLAQEGYTLEAVKLFTNIMAAIVRGLRDFKGFFPYFDIQDGSPAGKRNALAGLAPVKLFLQLAGIRLFSPTRVAIWGRNPFPWPVEVHWQGLSIRRVESQTMVTFPDGTDYQGETEESLLLVTGTEGEMDHE
jgi:hypothetical protein